MTITTTNYGFILPTPNDPGSANTWGSTLNDYAFTPIDTYLLATALSNIGTTAPTIPNSSGSPYQGQMWINTSGTLPISTFTLNVYSGNDWVTMGTVNIPAGTYTPAGVVFTPIMPNIQTFTANGTYTQTSGCLYVVAEVLGAGAGGGNNSGGSYNGAGGAGCYIKSTLSAAGIGSSQTITVAGVAGPGVNGGQSSIGTLIQAAGGTAGNSNNAYSANGGAGGISVMAPSGSIIVPGQAGTTSWSANSTGANGVGGSTIYGSGGQGTKYASSGISATGYGAGGSGSMDSGTGGSGSAGIVIITEYFQ